MQVLIYKKIMLYLVYIREYNLMHILLIFFGAYDFHAYHPGYSVMEKISEKYRETIYMDPFKIKPGPLLTVW